MLNAWRGRVKRLGMCQQGLATVEYAVLLALIVVVCLSAIRMLSRTTDRSLDQFEKSMAKEEAAANRGK